MVSNQIHKLKTYSKQYFEIEDVKNRFINAALLVGTVLGFFAFIPSVINSYNSGFIKISNISDFVILVLFGIIYIFRNKINLKVKTLIILSGLLLFVVTDAFYFGIFSDNKILIVILLVISFLIFSRKLTIWLAVIISAAYFVLAYYTVSGILKPLIEPNVRAVSPDVWIIKFLLIAIVSVAMILLLSGFNKGFLRLIRNLEEKNKYIKEKESNYTEIFNAVTDAIFIHDLEGKIIDANESMVKMFGYSKEELSKTDSKVFNPGDPYDFKHFKEYLKRTLKTGKSVFEWHAKAKNGNLIWVEITLTRTKIGGKDSILFVVKNIDKQKKALLKLEKYKTGLEKKVKERTEELEAANEELISNNEELVILNENIEYQKNIIEEKEKRLESIINNQGEGVSINDTDENFLMANFRAHEIFNVPEGKLVGMNLKDFFDDNEWEKIKRQSDLRKNKVRSSYETKITLKDGTVKYLIVTATPDLDRDGNIIGYIANFRDITERIYKENKLKELNEEFESVNEELNEANEELIVQKDTLQNTLNELKQTQNKLIQSEKMASIGVLASGVAHEINNPLNYIMGGVTGLETICKEQIIENKERIKPIMDAIKEGVRRTGEIVSGLNLYSRKTESKREDCDIHSVIENCFIILADKLKDRIEIKKFYNETPVRVKCNTGQIQQVFLNILSNAEQSIGKKGIISVTTEKDSEYVFITFEDNGAGIKKENLSKITDPFFTTKDPGKGTGLGLSIVQNIIEEHNGFIDIKSNFGKGTKVIIKLPNDLK